MTLCYYLLFIVCTVITHPRNLGPALAWWLGLWWIIPGAWWGYPREVHRRSWWRDRSVNYRLASGLEKVPDRRANWSCHLGSCRWRSAVCPIRPLRQICTHTCDTGTWARSSTLGTRLSARRCTRPLRKSSMCSHRRTWDTGFPCTCYHRTTCVHTHRHILI